MPDDFALDRGAPDIPHQLLGAGYDLAIELGPPDDVRLERAFRTLVRALCVEQGRSHAGETLELLRLDARDLLRSGALWIWGPVPGSGPVRCRILVQRTIDLDAAGSPPLDDYLGVLLPWSEVAGADPYVAHDRGSTFPEDWSERVDDWFEALTRVVHEQVPIRYAITGFDAYGEDLDSSPTLGRLVPDGRGVLTRIRPVLP